ncbi:MAG: toll/interleukin-1 receptor domain-containing protein [Pseudomonadota bacterium]
MEEEAADKSGQGSDSQKTFSAFISYSHANAAAVRKLHAQIEAYRLPEGLGTVRALNGQKGRLGQIFRDREDLSAAQDLSSAIKNALDRSHVLLVACSPAAKASPWVNQEIAYFRQHSPGRPILAAILDGEPAEAFPEALTEGGSEPLAADLRKQGDGWRLGFLKLVAGIADVPLDALVQRDSQRQLRRVMAVTGMVALFAIAMSVMTMVALQARNEAQSLRRNSDIFVERQLTEGRRDLKAVGRLDILQKFNNRTLEFYAQQGEIADLPADSLEIWARLLHAIGEDYEATGDLDAALENFTRSHGVTEELLQREPDNPDRIFAHAQSQYWIGRIDELNGNFDAAAVWYKAYQKTILRLQEVEADTERTVSELAYAANNLGILALNKKDFQAAKRFFVEAIAHFSSALELSGGDLEMAAERANARAWLASAYYQSGALTASRAERVRQLAELNEILAQDPENRAFQYKKIVCEYAILKIDERLGNAGLAKRKSDLLERISALRRIEPEDRDWLEMEEKIRSVVI